MKKEVVEKVQLHSLLMFHYIRSMYPLLQKTSIPQIRYYLMIYFINKSTQNMNFLLQFPHIKATCSKKGSRHMYALHTFCQCLEIWEKIIYISHVRTHAVIFLWKSSVIILDAWSLNWGHESFKSLQRCNYFNLNHCDTDKRFWRYYGKKS